eukprot:scaffold146746_cov50-Prasinocladus_malaysianus.AAC.1
MPGGAPARLDHSEQAAIAAALKEAARRRSQERNPQPAPTSFLRPGQGLNEKRLCVRCLQQFRGAQSVSHLRHGNEEDWCIRVSILSCDLKVSTRASAFINSRMQPCITSVSYYDTRTVNSICPLIHCVIQTGSVCGTMEAENVPHARSPVTTFWEGEIVDNVNYSFFTNKWGASLDTDMKHWSKFARVWQQVHLVTSEVFLLAVVVDYSQLARAAQEAVVLDGGRSAALEGYPFIFMRWKEKCFVNCSHDCGLTIA